jgi:hypothetical protein
MRFEATNTIVFIFSMLNVVIIKIKAHRATIVIIYIGGEVSQIPLTSVYGLKQVISNAKVTSRSRQLLDFLLIPVVIFRALLWLDETDEVVRGA